MLNVYKLQLDIEEYILIFILQIMGLGEKHLFALPSPI